MANWLKYFFCLVLFFGIGYSNGFGQLKADFTTSPPSGCTPVVVSFKDNSTGNPEKWRWEIDQPGIYETKDISALFLKPGSYNIKLTVYKGNDSSSVTRIGLVNVYEIPVAIFEADVVEGCKPLRVNFTNKSIPGSGTIGSAIWDFGDGNSGSAINPVQIFKTSGRYNVTLTVANSFGCKKSISYPNFIHVFDSVNADFTFKTIPSCGAPFPVEFRDTSIGKNITEWKWLFGDGETSSLQHPNHSYASKGNYAVQLITQSKDGCADTLTKTVSVFSGNFLADFSHPAKVCKNSPLSFTNTSSPLNLADSARWDFGDGSFSSNISPIKVYSNPGNYTVKLTMYYGNCMLTKTGSVEILPGPQIDFTGSPLFSCKPPLTINFTSTVTNGTIERWRIGPRVFSPQANPNITLWWYGVENVWLIAKGADGCVDSLLKPNYIKIQKPTILGLPGLPFNGCFPWSHNFKANISSLDSISKWEWDFGDGRTSNQKNPTITFSQRGDYNVKLKVFTDNGCSDSLTTLVKGGIKPVVDFTAWPVNVCPSEPVTFTANIKGNYDSLRWVFGDGGVSSLPNPAYLYQDTGKMNVTLYAWDRGCMDSITNLGLIYVNPPLSKFGIVSNCSSPFKRNFVDSSFGATSWLWDFGNGVTSTEKSPVYTYPDTGRYKVSLRVSDGNCFHTSFKNILVLAERPDFEYSQTGNCDSTTLMLNAKGLQLQPGNISIYTWNFSDGVSMFNKGSSVKRVFKTPQLIRVMLAVNDLNGCITTISKDISVKLLGPLAKIAPESLLFCSGKTIIFPDSSYRNSASPIVKWTWNFGVGKDTTFLNPPFSYTYRDTGFYNLKLIVEDINGCIDSIRADSAVGIYNPMANFISPDTIVCTNTDVRFSNLSQGYGLKYKWTLGESDMNTNFEPVKKYRRAGKYNIKLEVTDTAGCVSIIDRLAYINVGGAIADFSMSDSLASCPPLLVHFKNKSIGATNIQWDFNNGNNSILEDPSQTFTETGTYRVKLTITGNGGCIDTMVREVNIRGPQGTITYFPLQGCPPLQVTFSSNTANVKSYIWDFSDGQTSFTTDSTVTYTYLTPGIYRPRVILEDGQSCRIPIQGSQDIKIIGVRSLIKSLKSYQYCDSAVISFFDSSITNDGIKRWEWDFGDGTRSSEPNPIHKYTTPGHYRVSLLVETFDNCINLSVLPAEIQINSSPRIEAIRDTTFCLPGNILFKSQWLNPDSTTLQWQWNFGNGTTSNLRQPDSVLYNKRGVYQQTLRVTHNNGCSDLVRSSITVKDRAEAYIVNIGNYDFCNSGTVTFKDSTTSENLIDKWIWDFGDGNFSNQRNPVHTYTQPGRYRASLAVETSQNCISVNLLPGVITVAPSPKMDIGSDTVLCLSSLITFTPKWLNPDTTNVSYNWDFGNGTTSTLQRPPAVTYSRAGIIRAKLFVQNEYGCTDSAFRQITVHSDPKIIIGKLSPEIFCDSAVVNLTSNISSTDSIKNYLWSFGDGAISADLNPAHTYRTPGKYKIGLAVTTVNNCPAKAEYEGVITLATRPRINFSSDSVLCVPSSVLFTGKWLNPDTSTLKWQWDFGNGITSSQEKPGGVLYDKAGIYMAKLTVSSQVGCADSMTRAIRVNDVPGVLITQLIPDIFCDSAVVKFKGEVSSIDPISSYLWNFGDGNTSTEISPSYTYKTPGIFKVSLSVNTPFNCPSTGQYNGNITLARSPRIRVLSDSVFCGPSSVVFEGQWLNRDTTRLTWNWDFGNGKTGSGIKPDPVDFETAGTYNVVTTATNNFGCKDSITRRIVVNDIPKVLITQLIPDIFCDSAVVKFKGEVSSTDSISSYLWNFGDGNTSTEIIPSYTYKTPGIFKVSLSVNTPFNCPSTGQYNGNITLARSPRIRVLSDSVFCGPSSVVFEGQWLNRDTTRLTWNWDFGNGKTGSGIKPDPVDFETAGTYNVVTTATNNFGCKDSITRRIVVNDIPKVLITQLIPDIFCDSAVVKFKGEVSSTDSISSYLWNFGDGSTSTQVNPTYTYNKPGLFKVSLMVNTAFNCPATGQYNGAITLATSPKIRVLSDSVFCGTSSVNFEGQWLNKDTTVLTWDWNFGNGKTGTGIKPAPVDFEHKGTYKVITVATNNFGCKDSISRNVVVNDIPKVTINNLSQFVYCDSATIQFRETTVVDGTANSWQWNFGDGTTSNQREPLHTYKKPGIYNISLEVGTTSNCASISNLSGPVVISQSPDITLPGDTLFCIPHGVYFGAQWLNPDTTTLKWAWNFGNGQAAANQFPGLIRYDKPGNYTATLRAVNEYGCRDSLSRLIVAKDTPNIKISGSLITCQGQGVTLLASGAESYRWEPQASLSCFSCPNPVATPLASQVYTVTGSNGPGGGCERSKSLQINIIQPRRIITSRGDSLCVGDSYQLLASGLDKYIWSPSTGLSATNIANPVARPQQSIVYRVVATDSLNCFSDTAFVPIGVFKKPFVNILKDKYIDFSGTRIALKTESTDVTRWRWSPSVGLSCITCPSPELTITQQITYKVWVTNPGGCEAVDEVTIEPICSAEEIFVPNTFSPNGDGRNDVFYPMGKGVSVIKSLRIYNRWGEVVFERQNLQPNDPSAGWDGSFKGRPLNPDVYVYAMVVLCFNNESIDMKGNVTLLK